jgi:hypothetical protein
MASLRDHTGSFGPALGIIIAASLVAMVLVLRIRLPARERLARAA